MLRSRSSTAPASRSLRLSALTWKDPWIHPAVRAVPAILRISRKGVNCGALNRAIGIPSREIEAICVAAGRFSDDFAIEDGMVAFMFRGCVIFWF